MFLLETQFPDYCYFLCYWHRFEFKSVSFHVLSFIIKRLECEDFQLVFIVTMGTRRTLKITKQRVCCEFKNLQTSNARAASNIKYESSNQGTHFSARARPYNSVSPKRSVVD
jgi:UDP-galactopyranose mutase